MKLFPTVPKLVGLYRLRLFPFEFQPAKSKLSPILTSESFRMETVHQSSLKRGKALPQRDSQVAEIATYM
jgi:hypothetical protein